MVNFMPLLIARRLALPLSSMLWCAWGALGLLAAPRQAHADATSEVRIVLNQDGERLAQELGLDTAGFARDLEQKVESALQISEVQRFLKSFANASSFSNRGIGVDYASNSDRYVFGFAANLAVSADLGAEDDDELPTVGVAPSFTLMGGMNLRRWNHPELTVFGNVFHYGADSGALHGGVTSVGLHGQLKLFTPTAGVARHFARWGGIDITAGLELARWQLGLGGEISHTFEFPIDGGLSSDVTAAVGGRFDVGATTLTMPLEVTTNVRLLYVLGLYTGFGLDLQVGEASIGASTFGSLRATRPGSPEIVDTIGDVSASAEGSHGPSTIGYHLLLGAQVNLWRIKVFTQLTMQPISSVSAAVGMRVVI